MKKSEIKNLTDRELIVEYVRTYSHYDTNSILGRGIEQLAKQLRNIEAELVKRNILTEDDINYLNS